MRRGLAFISAAIPLLGAALAMAPAGAAQPICGSAEGSFHVALSLRHSDAEPNWLICVPFGSSTPTFDPGNNSISGEELLKLSGHPYVTWNFGGSLGDALCQVDNEPKTPSGGFNRNNCFGNPYWETWTWENGQWVVTNYGITNERYFDGGAEGLSYGQPAPASPGSICPPPQPKPTVSPSSSSLSSSSNTRTAVVGATPSAAPGATAASQAGPSPSLAASASGASGSALVTQAGAPRPAANPAAAARGKVGVIAFKPSVGWLAAVAASVVLLGMLTVQLLARGRGT